MKSLLVTTTLLLCFSSTFARPQGDYNDISNPGGGGPCQTQVKCKRAETAPGVYTFDCATSNPCVISREDILWLKGSNEGQQLNVVVPNYKLEEVIKAAFKSQGSAGTSVNILLKRPEQSVEAEADVSIPEAQAPQVNLEYEPVGPREYIHYPVDKPYRPLSGRILEPDTASSVSSALFTELA